MLILPDGAFSIRGAGMTRADAIGGDAAPPDPTEPNAEQNIPEEYRGRRGAITTAKTVPHPKKFLEDGGTILTIGLRQRSPARSARTSPISSSRKTRMAATHSSARKVLRTGLAVAGEARQAASALLGVKRYGRRDVLRQPGVSLAGRVEQHPVARPVRWQNALA